MGASCSSDASAVVNEVARDIARPRTYDERHRISDHSRNVENKKQSHDEKSEKEEEADGNSEIDKSEKDEEEKSDKNSDDEKEAEDSDKASDDNKSEKTEPDKDSDPGETDSVGPDTAFVPVPKRHLSEGERLTAALEGKLDVAYPNLSRIVRIFTSSTFTDTQVERNTLMAKIYPRLKTFCQERGYDFQVVDMRWGVRDEATQDHMTSELCMRELTHCQNLSTGPNFITFLGQKYGYRPFPPKIEARLFENILSATEATDDKNLLNFWFAKDENSLAQYYLLHPISSKLPAYVDEENAAKKKQAQDKWWSDFERMQVILRNGVSKASQDPQVKHRYFWSVTEEEIFHGILNAKDTEQHCYWFKRVITDLAQNTKSKNTRRFMDIGADVDQEALALLNELKDKKIPAKLPGKNVKTYEVKWTENGIDPDNCEEHRRYIESLTSDFYRILCEMIERGMNQKKALFSASPLELECMQHATFAQKKVDSFYGREDLLQQIKDHIIDNQSTPLVLCGKPGSGKTSLLARSMELLTTWLGDSDVIIVGRFIGTSTDSSSIRKLLISICQQLTRACDQTIEDLEEKNLQSLATQLEELMENCGEIRPIYIFLDSLDQLDDSLGGRKMGWLPKCLPDNTCLVMSTVPDEEYSVLPSLKQKYSNIEYIDVPELATTDIATITAGSLKAKGRQLQPSQLATVKSACEKCATPLFLKIAVDEALRWKSYTPPEEAVLKTTVSDVINALFDRVEKYHGKVLVRHVLAYITCAKSGLSENEIEDAISCDDDVLNDVYQYHTPPLRRLPPLLWVRIRADLKDYLTDRGADDIQVITWYHRQFHQVAVKRYLSDTAFRKQCHSHLADYFLQRWANGVKKPYTDKKGVKSEADRLVAAQPYVIKDDGTYQTYNLRKLNELPYHLIKLGNAARLKKEVFCNLMFLHSKLAGVDFSSVFDDLTLAENEGLLDDELTAVKDVLLRSRNIVSVDPDQLPLQLAARLIEAGHRDLPHIKVLLEQCLDPPFQCLTTLQGFLKGKSGSLLQKLVGHEISVDSIGTSRDGKRVATAGMDSKVKIWDAESGNEILDIPISDYCVNTPQSFLFCQNNLQLAITSVNQFAALDLRSGTGLKSLTITENLPNHSAPIGFLSDCGWALILREKLFVFKEGTWDQVHTIQGLVPTVKEPHHQQRDFCGGSGKLAVLYRAGSGHAQIVDLQNYVKDKSGVTKVNLLDKGQKPSDFITQIELTESGLIPCLSYEADKYMDNVCTIKVFSLKDGSLLKSFRGFDVGFVVGSGVIEVRDNKHIVFPIFVAAESNTSIIDVNLDTGKHRKVGSVLSVCNCLTPLDDHRLLAISAASNDVVDVLQVEEDRAGQAEQAEQAEQATDSLVEDKYDKQVELVEPIPDSRRYMLSGYGNKALQIWDAGNMRMVRDIKIKGYTSLARMTSSDLAVTLTHTDEVMVYDMKTPKSHGAQKKGLNKEGALDGKLAVTRGKALLATKQGLEIRDIIGDKVECVISVEDKKGLAQIQLDRTKTVAAGKVSATEENKVIYMFDIQKQTRLPDIKCTIKDFEFSWDGKYIAGRVSEQKTSSAIWDVRTGTKRSIPDHEDNSVTCLNFSEMTNCVLTGMNSGFIALYDVDSLKLVRDLKSARSAMSNSMTVSNSGRYVCTTGFNNSEVYVFDLTNGQNVGNITADNMLGARMFTWDDQFILFAASSVRGVVQIYLHDPSDKKRREGKEAPIITAKKAILKEPAMYGTEMVTDDFSQA